MSLRLYNAILNLGFRPFFLAAGFFSVASVSLWALFYSFGWATQPAYLSQTQWHAHEMIFGYAMAVVAGFLLTAVKNWTGIKTISSTPLLALFLLWFLARLIPFINLNNALIISAILNGLFLSGLIIALAIPVFKSRQWKQIGILSKVLLILVSNIVFYAGVNGAIEDGIRWGLYGGLYLILALIFMMARRVIPFFIEKGLGGTVRVKNSRLLDISSLVIFLFFMVFDIAQPNGLTTMILAVVLFSLHSLRLIGWYNHGIWRVPMLWSLYIAYCFLVLGFALKIGAWFFAVSPFLSIHAFTYGGIGLMTLGMMSRVALGHTGRDINQPPLFIPLSFFILTLGAIFRVIMPVVDPQTYSLWITISQVLWITAFAIFFVSYLPILVKPRVDGQTE